MAGWLSGYWYCEVRADGGDVKVCVRDCVQSCVCAAAFCSEENHPS